MNQYKHGGVGKGTDPRDMPPGTKIMIVDRRVSAQPNGRRVLHSACATRLARPPAGRTCGVRQAPSPAGFGQTHAHLAESRWVQARLSPGGEEQDRFTSQRAACRARRRETLTDAASR